MRGGRDGGFEDSEACEVQNAQAETFRACQFVSLLPCALSCMKPVPVGASETCMPYMVSAQHAQLMPARQV